MNTPILFLIFKRPDTTQQVFDAIRWAKPKYLYIAANAPRLDIEGEKEKCEKTRDIIKQIDWDCEIKTLFRDEYLSAKESISSAINWFFENVEEGIILEDDCLPSHSFFGYCEELLTKYRDDERIMLISGFNKQNIWNSDKYDYFFSNLGGLWGWASWKRAWSKYDIKMSRLDFFSENHFFEYLLGNKLGKKRKEQMYSVIKNNIDTWDYQWGFSRHINSGMACVPSKNLIKNIGCGVDATNTKEDLDLDSLSLHELNFSLKENNIVVADGKYDALFFKQSRKERLINLLLKIRNFILK